MHQTLSVVLAAASFAAAQECEPVETAKILPTAKGFIETFGTSMDIDAGRLVVGASREDVWGVGTDAGAVRVYEKIGGVWKQTDFLTHQFGTSYDAFGAGVAVQGDLIVVGATGDNGFGAAHIFTHVGAGLWEQGEALSADEQTNLFGLAVAIDQETIVVGEPHLSQVGHGAAFIFELSDGVWTQTQKLTASDGFNGDTFGRTIAIEGDLLVIGAETAAYVFNRTGGVWTEIDVLTPVADAIPDNLPMSVALKNGTIVIGSPEDDTNGHYAGAVFIYENIGGEWTQTDKLVAADGSMIDYVGSTVDFDGETIVAGAYGASPNGHFSGAAYVFTGDQQSKLTPADGQANDFFGFRAAVEGDDVVVGAVWAAGTGAAYAWDISCTCLADCNEDGALNVLDFVCYQNLFQAGDAAADCNADGALNVLDFVCFQNAFNAGCN